MAKYSIIIPIYNVEQYLKRCVESVINQTYRDIEIILVDDGSPDRCFEMCDEYALRDCRVKVIHKKNGGLSDARNAGLKVATGDYVVFVDSDDYIEKDTCEKFLKYTSKGYDILIGEAVIEGGHASLEHISPSNVVLSGKEYLYRALKEKKAPMAVCLNIFRREYLLSRNLIFKVGRLHEDEEFSPRAFLAAHSVICTGIVFYHYVIRECSITTIIDKRNNADSLYKTCLELQELYNTIQDKKLRCYLLDSLSAKYLSLVQSGNLVQYGERYLHRGFVIKSARRFKTKLKALLYLISPKVYYLINNFVKKRGI